MESRSRPCCLMCGRPLPEGREWAIHCPRCEDRIRIDDDYQLEIDEHEEHEHADHQ